MMALVAPSFSADGATCSSSRDIFRHGFVLAGMHVCQNAFQPVATGLKTVKAIQQKIPFLMLIRPRGQQPVRRRLNKPGDVNRVAERQRVSITRTSTVPKCGLGRMSQCRSLMLSIMLVELRRRNSPSNSCQLLTHGICPLSGKPEKMLRRDEANFVSVPCIYGDAAAGR